MFILDLVYNIRGLLRRNGVHPDQMPASCVSVLSSRGTYSGWQHITFMSSSGKASFPSTLGMKAICGTEATSTGNCRLWKSHWITAQVTEACILWMEEKKRNSGHWWLYFLPYWCPLTWGLMISKIKGPMLTLLVYTTINFSHLFLEQISNDKLSKLVPVFLLYSIRPNVMFRCDPSIRLSNFRVLLNSESKYFDI